MDPAPGIETVEVWKAYIRILRKLKNIYPFEYAKIPELLKRCAPADIEGLKEEDVQALKAAAALPGENPESRSPDEVLQARVYIRLLGKLIGAPGFADVPPVLRWYCAGAAGASPAAYGFFAAQAAGAACDAAGTAPAADDKAADASADAGDKAQAAKARAGTPAAEALDNLDPEHTEALRMMNVFPPEMFPPPAITPGPYYSRPYAIPANPPQTQTPPPAAPVPLSDAALAAAQAAARDNLIAKTMAQIGQMYSEGHAAVMSSIIESGNKMGEVFRKAGG